MIESKTIETIGTNKTPAVPKFSEDTFSIMYDSPAAAETRAAFLTKGRTSAKLSENDLEFMLHQPFLHRDIY